MARLRRPGRPAYLARDMTEPPAEQSAAPPAAPLADAATQTRLKKQATIASVIVAALLIAAKLAAWLMTDSVAVLSSLVDPSSTPRPPS